MPNETNTVGATMELGRLRIENESLRQQNSELVSMLKISLPMLDKTVGGENCAELARAILAKVQSS